jgi:ligand-binding SRPBCC domain-containing protein
VRVYRFQREQCVSRRLPEVFHFFSDPRNLALLTPPELRFEIIDAPAELHAGSRIRYRLRPFGVPIRWTSGIVQWNPPHLFSDVQLSGPYGLWEHIHSFYESADGTRIVDDVRYALPFGWLGRAAHSAVQHNLDGIFAYRHARIEAMFGAAR